MERQLLEVSALPQESQQHSNTAEGYVDEAGYITRGPQSPAGIAKSL